MLAELQSSLHAAHAASPLLPELAGLLAAVANARDDLARGEAWIALLDWTRGDTTELTASSSTTSSTNASSDGVLASTETSRLRLLLHALEVCAPVRARIQASFASLLASGDATGLIAETGMPSDRGFVAEALTRVWQKVLPEPRDSRDLEQLLRRSFRTAGHVTRFTRWPKEIFDRAVAVLLPPDTPVAERLHGAVGEAVRLLTVRAVAQGLAPKLRSRSRPLPIAASPWIFLQQEATILLASRTPAELAAAQRGWSKALADCREEIAEIHRQGVDEGISVDIVFGLDVLDRCLTRLELLGALLTAETSEARLALTKRLLARLVHYAYHDRSLRALAGSNLHLLHQRIVERSSETGEHYIARDRAEYRHLLLAAAGGGVLTIFTAAIKLAAHDLHISPFQLGIVYGLNYAVSFMILHHCHLVLATKQPAMTAATLATIMRSRDGTDRFDIVIDRIARICHSQLAAAAGNVVVVGLGALAFTNIWHLTFGTEFLNYETAEHLYSDLGPLTSGTVFYAALTGVILWLSSLIGGWLDNWSAWHRIPEGIADHHLGTRLGRDRLRRWGQAWRRNIGGWGTNISLGFMLGLTPAVGTFLGVPLDVRHVTLSTGMLFTACGSLGDGWWSGGWFLNALAGIAVMFVLNLGVSFALSLGTAVRALEIPRADQFELLRRLARRLFTHPGDFILPPRTPLTGTTL
jgi:site-specific recombinase